MEEFILNEDQIKILKKIYWSRKNLIIVIIGSSPAFLFIFFSRLLDNEEMNFYTSILILILLLGIFIFSIIFLYKRKVLIIKKDIELKSGVYLNLEILRKSYFQHTGTYFIFFQDTKLPNKEVTAEEYNIYREGDIYKIPVSKNSKLVLDGFMNYKLI